MNTKLTDEEILKEYAQADDAHKQLLERHYGKEMFVKPTDFRSLETVADCCVKQGVEIENVKVALHPSLSKYEKALQATLESFIVRDAIANNVEVKIGQTRYSPYFIEKAGVGFVFSLSCYGDDFSSFGSRLEFPNKKQSDYFGKTFTELNKRRLVS